MTENNKKEKYPSTFTIDNFSSTTKLADNDYKVPIGSVDTIAEKDYNPYEHRNLEHPTTFSGALMHLLKSSLGTGILAIPSAVKAAGIITGTIGTLIVGILCTHTIHLLIYASQQLCKKSKVPSLGFAETAKAVFEHGPPRFRSLATAAGIFVEAALLLTYYSATAVYIVFVTTTIQEVVNYQEPSVSDWPVQYYMLILLVPLILCCQIRALKHLVPFSIIANTTMIVAFGITLYYMFVGISDIDISDRKLATDITLLPKFFSTVLFAMEGIGTMLPIENSMTKQQFLGCPGVLNFAMGFVTTLYTIIGLFGYIRFGDSVEASVVTNLPVADIIFVDVALLLTYYAGNAVYIVFICGTIQELVNYYEPSYQEWPIQYYMLILLIPLIICCQVRSLKHLVPFSIVANITMIVAFGITLYYMFSGITEVDLSDRKLINDVALIPLFFSTVLFAMEGIGTMLPIENAMVKQQFIGCPGVLNSAMSFVTILYIVIGFFGYLRFGDNVQANVIANLPDKDIIAQVAKVCIAVAVFFTFMLQFYVPVDITWRKLQPRIPQHRHNIAQIILRTILVLFVTVIAAAVPKLDAIIALVGSVFFSTLGLFVPVVIDTILNMGDDGDFGFMKWRLWKNILVIVLSWFALFSGSYYAIKGLIED